MANNIISFLLLPGMSIGTGIIAIVGQNLGAKNISRVEDILKKGFFVTLIIMITVASFLISFKEIIIETFTNDLEVVGYANSYFLLASIGAVGFGLQQVFWRIDRSRLYKACYDCYLYSSLDYSFASCVYFAIFWIYGRFVGICFYNFKLCGFDYLVVFDFY